jgi:predicted ATPase
VLVSGEAGVGKSRLVQTLIEHVLPEPHFRLVMRCSPYHQNSAFYPVIDLLQRVLEFQPGDSAAAKLTKLEQNLSRYSSVPPETLPLIASLLSLPSERPTLPAMPPQRQRQRTMEALLAWLFAGASPAPLLLVIEDLHWIDPSTREMITLLLDQLPMARILALFTFRPEFTPLWPPRSHLSTLTVTRLGRQQVGHMVEHLAGGKRLPREVSRHIVAKADGIPLYVEELSKMILELGLLREREGRYELTGPLPTETIPATLSDSLMARLDRLSTVKDVVQLGATIGREFSYEVLRAISPHDEATLQFELSRLVDAEVLYQSGFLPQVTYIFKHALIREAAYQSLLKSTRQQYHQQIAQVLAERFPDIAETEPELLAQHLTAAELITEAIPYWQRAGQKVMPRFANAEAISHFSMALELLHKLPLTAERNRTELALCVALSGPLLVTKGYAAPEVGTMYSRALELSQQSEDSLELATVLSGLTAFYVARGELRSALLSAERLPHIAQRVQNRALSLAAHTILAVPLFWLGDVARARAHWEEGFALYDPQRAHLYGGVQDFGVTCLSYLGLALWIQGYPDQAITRAQEAIALARQLDHPFSVAWAMNFSSRVWQCRRETAIVQEQSTTLINLTTEQGLNQHRAHAMILHGWTLAAEGKGEEGIALMQEGLAALRVTGAELSRPWFMTMLAEGYGMHGQFATGIEVLADARRQAEQSEEKVSLPEIYRLIGELTLQQERQKAKMGIRNWELGSGSLPSSSPNPTSQIPDPASEAEEYFLKAIETAREQQAKSFELRAVMSLVRLQQSQAMQHESRTSLDKAHNMLSEVYNWFTEGFDTKDLQEAKVLLEELRR